MVHTPCIFGGKKGFADFRIFLYNGWVSTIAKILGEIRDAEAKAERQIKHSAHERITDIESKTAAQMAKISKPQITHTIEAPTTTDVVVDIKVDSKKMDEAVKYVRDAFDALVGGGR